MTRHPYVNRSSKCLIQLTFVMVPRSWSMRRKANGFSRQMSTTVYSLVRSPAIAREKSHVILECWCSTSSLVGPKKAPMCLAMSPGKPSSRWTLYISLLEVYTRTPTPHSSPDPRSSVPPPTRGLPRFRRRLRACAAFGWPDTYSSCWFVQTGHGPICGQFIFPPVPSHFLSVSRQRRRCITCWRDMRLSGSPPSTQSRILWCRSSIYSVAQNSTQDICQRFM